MVHIELLSGNPGTASIAMVSASTTYYSSSFRVENGEAFGLWYKCNIANSSLTVSLEQGYDRPSTEYAADSNWVIPTGLANIEDSMTSSLALITSLSPVTMPYARLKFGTAAATTSCSITAYLGLYEGAY